MQKLEKFPMNQVNKVIEQLQIKLKKVFKAIEKQIELHF